MCSSTMPPPPYLAQTEHLSPRPADAMLAPTLHGALYCTLGAGKRWIDGHRNGVVLNGEMVVQDGGAHLRGSGAEDLLQWNDAQWEQQCAARSKN